MPAANPLVRLWWAWPCAAALSGQSALAQSTCRVLTPTLQATYQGECQQGLAHGQGSAQGSDRYQGQFQAGQPHGLGSYLFADGRRFDGQFVAGRVSGPARFQYANGDVLEGEFRDNRLSGYGRLQRAGQAAAVLVQLSADGRLQAVDGAVAATAAQPPAPAPAQPPQAAIAQAGVWEAQLDFQDLFPSYLFATATRRQPEAPKAAAPGARAGLASASPALSRGDFIPPLRTAGDAAQGRYIGTHANVSYLGDAWGLVGIRYRAGTAGQRVRLRVEADQILEPTETEFELGAAGDYALYPKLRYRYERLKEVQQPRPVHLRWQVWINGQPAGQQERTVQLRSLQDAPFYVKGPRGPEIMGWVFAAYVTEDAPWIDGFLKEAFASYRSGSFGYQGGPEGVDDQVAIVYEALQKRGFKYSDITGNSSEIGHIASQTVRLPSQAMKTAQANCVDGTVLMASILRRIGIDSYIVLGPGHAMLAYLRKPEAKVENLVVVETTALGQHPFAKAVAAGNAKFLKWQKEVPDTDPRFQIVNISTQRRQGVMPIPL